MWRNSRLRLLTSVDQFITDSANLYGELRQIKPDDSPYEFCVYARVLMDQPVSHPLICSHGTDVNSALMASPILPAASPIT